MPERYEKFYGLHLTKMGRLGKYNFSGSGSRVILSEESETLRWGCGIDRH
jgi:hypothetical protein